MGGAWLSASARKPPPLQKRAPHLAAPLGGHSAGAEETEAAVTLAAADARASTKEANPAKSPPATMIASHTKPTATVSTGAAPNGATSAANATSRTPMPPCVTGNSAEILASGQANSHTRNGTCRPQPAAIAVVSRTKPICSVTPSPSPSAMYCGWREIDRAAWRSRAKRSEEHTSELQSLAYLVCRLLLEKKK